MRTIQLLFALLLIPSIAHAQWTKGFDFRDGSAYCTDATPNTYFRYPKSSAEADFYPVTRNSVTFGGTTYNGDNRRDRDSAVDCRLAGCSFVANNAASPMTMQVDLPAAGKYKVFVAIGEAGGFTAGSNQKVQFYDNSTLLDTITGNLSSANTFMDTTGTIRTSASDWVSNNASKTYTFATTTFYMKFGYGDGSTSGNTFVAHLRLEQAPDTGWSASFLEDQQ